MTRLKCFSMLLILMTPVFGFAAPIILTPGDIGPSYPSTMIHDRAGLLLTHDESWVYSGTAFPYPEEFTDAEELRITFYFIPDATTAGNVHFKCLINTYGVGDQYNYGGYILDSPAVPVGGTEEVVYAQEFSTNDPPPPGELFQLAIGRDVNLSGDDTYPTGVYLHAIKIEPVYPTHVVDDVMPAKPNLSQNYPNPFNPETEILFALPDASRVDVVIYDVSGRVVRQLITGEYFEQGQHRVTWNGRDDADRRLANGPYFYRLRTEEETVAKKMIKLK